MRFVVALMFTALTFGCSSPKEKQASNISLRAPATQNQRPDPWTVDSQSPANTLDEEIIRIRSSFSESTSGWVADAAGFPETMNDRIGFFAGLTPTPLGSSGYELRGSNEPVTLFMFLSRQLTAVDGIQPGLQYKLRTRVKFISGAAKDCMGAGGSPGDVAFRVGGFAEMVQRTHDENGTRRINHDPWMQPQAFDYVGAIDNGRQCNPELTDYARLSRVTDGQHLVRAGEDGTLTVLVGVSGGFIGETRLWIESIDLILEPLY